MSLPSSADCLAPVPHSAGLSLRAARAPLLLSPARPASRAKGRRDSRRCHQPTACPRRIKAAGVRGGRALPDPVRGAQSMAGGAERGRGGLLCPGRPERRIPGATGPPRPGAAGRGQGSSGAPVCAQFLLLLGTPRTTATRQAPLSMESSTQEFRRGLRLLLQWIVPGQASTPRPTGVSSVSRVGRQSL